MAASRGAMPRPGEVPCPDPAAHGHGMQRSSGGRDPFGSDGKMSTASKSPGAAASLRYAKPNELPSFPSVGIDTSSGNRAATLANQNSKPFEYWKPSLSSSASKAALLATDRASKNKGWKPSSTAQGHSAAGIAMAKRNRAGSNASTSYSEYSHIGDDANDTARLKNMHGAMPREMFTEHPPIQIEIEEKRRNDALRASSISMAKQMFEAQRRAADPNVPTNAKTMVAGYVNLQEVAQRLANERLAKLDPDGVMAYRDHYGVGNASNAPRASMTQRLKAWPGEPPKAVDPDAESSDDDDTAQAEKIRKQMNIFNDKLAGLDGQKRDSDREAVRLLAEKRVQARMADMDEKVFHETGKVPPNVKKEWDAKAKALAQADSEKRAQYTGKVHIGGGRYMDQSEIDAIAAARVQPTLDEISATAIEQRARDEQARVDAEHRRFVLETERQRERDEKAELRRVRDEERAHERNLKDSEKFKRDEERRQLDEENRGKMAEQKVISDARIKDDNEKRKIRLAEEKERMEKVRQEKEAKKKAERQAKEDNLRGERLAKEARLREEREAREGRSTAAAPVVVLAASGAVVASPEAEAELGAIVQKEAGGLPVEQGDFTEKAVEEEEGDAVFVEAPTSAAETAENGAGTREVVEEEEQGESASGITGHSGGKPITVDINSADLRRLQDSSVDSDSNATPKETVESTGTSTPILSSTKEAETLSPAISRPGAYTAISDRSRRNSNKLKGFLGKFRRSSRQGQSASSSIPTLASVAAPVAAIEATRELGSTNAEPAMSSTSQVETAPAANSTVLSAIFGNAAGGALEPEESVLPVTTGANTMGTEVERDAYTPTERAHTERATSIRSEGLYSEPSHQAKATARSDSPDISSISSDDEEMEVMQATRGRSGRSEVSDDEFEEARDRFDDTGSKISFANRDESPARNSSKFQEELA